MSEHRLQPIKSLIGYCYEFLKGARTAAKGRLHLRQGAAKRGYLDVATLVREEPLLFDTGEWFVRNSAPTTLDLDALLDIGLLFDDLDDSEEQEASAERSEETATEVPFEALRRLFGLLRGNPHELECLYGLYFLEGIDAKGTPVLAPLITAPVRLSYDTEKDAIRVEVEHDYAQLNTYAISELMPDSYAAMEDQLRDLSQLALPLDSTAIKRTLAILRTVGGSVNFSTSLLTAESNLRNVEQQVIRDDRPRAGQFSLRSYAALAVVRKTNVFVLDDLKEMQKLSPDSFEESLLSRFVLAEEGFGSNDDRRGRSLLGEGEILFPFPTNDHQNDVASSIERGGLIRVQGPPGTGKSQTIANVVCHLVARGNRVLVVSQQPKAVEVVESYLERLGIDFLPMTLIKGDKEATRNLKARLDGLAAFTFRNDASRLASRGRDAEARLATLRQRILALDAELGRFLTFEVSAWASTGKKPGELELEYSLMRERDRMAEGEFLSWGEQAEVTEGFKRIIDLTRQLNGKRIDLAYLCETSQLPRDEALDEFKQDIASIADVLRESLTICSLEERRKTEQIPWFSAISSVPAIDRVCRVRNELALQTRRLADLRDKQVVQETLNAISSYDQSACRADLEALCLLGDLIKELRATLDRSASCRNKSEDPTRLDEALEIYDAQRARWWSVLSPSFRRSSASIAAQLGRRRLLKGTDIAPVRAFVAAHRLRRRITDTSERRLSHLQAPSLPDELSVATERHLLNALSILRDVLQARYHAFETSSLIERTLFFEPSLDELLEESRVCEFQKAVGLVEKALMSDTALQRGIALVEKWKLKTAGGLLREFFDAFLAMNRDRVHPARDRLNDLLPLVSHYREIVSLLDGPLRPWRASAEKWIRLAEEIPHADLGSDLEAEVYSRALRTELNAIERAAPRNSASIAEERHSVEEKLRGTAREAVEAYLHSTIVKEYSNPAVGNEVRTFSQVLQRGRRNYEAFLKLKRSPKVFEAVLSVLPCWVASIQDVARVFPLKPGLFDVVIVDEASQCSIPAAMPLFMRSNKAIIVGDDKQLPCVEGKFVSRAYNAELMNRFSFLERVPRSQVFNACDSSLFDLAGSFTDKPIFLAEHFRCHPNIISFSNGEFYDHRLVILTHGMDQRLGPPLEVVLVEGATDDPKTKVNVQEAEAVVRKLRAMIDDSRYDGMDFGVCSPFRNQTDLIWELILKEFSDKEIKDRKLVSATADGFQGDERDVILYSFRFAPNSSPRIFTLTDGPEGRQRMNVAITRARRRALCFVSHSVESFPQGLVRRFLRHAQDPKATTFEAEPWDSQFEKDVHSFLEKLGLEVYPQVRACGYKLDFVIRGADGRTAALEADGWKIHYPDGHLREEDIQRESVLVRAGWTVFRVHSRGFYRDPEGSLLDVSNYFAEADEPQATAAPPSTVGEGASHSAAPSEVAQGARELTTERIDAASISLTEIQNALRKVAPDLGVEVRRDELFRRALPNLGLRRLSKRARERFQSAMAGLIRREEFGYRGRELAHVYPIREESTG